MSTAVMAGPVPLVTMTAETEGQPTFHWTVALEENLDGTWSGDYEVNQPEFAGNIAVFLDPDPEIVYAGSVIDFGAPTDFSFVFSQAIVPTGTPGTVFHTFSSSTTEGDADTTPVVALPPPLGIPDDGDGTDEMALLTLSTDGGATFLSAGVDLGPSFVGASPSDTNGPFTEFGVGPVAGGSSYSDMRIDVGFGLSGGNDIHTFNGRAIVVIPEPSSIVLAGIGLLIAAVSVRRRK